MGLHVAFTYKVTSMASVNKIKVVYVVPTLGQTGPSRQLFNLTKYLDKDVFEVVIITLSQSPRQNIEEEVRALNIRIICLGLGRVNSFTVGKKSLVSTLATLRPDVIHSQGFRPDWLCSKLKNYPVRIATQRNYPFQDYPALYGIIAGSVTAQLHYRALTKIPIVATCSQSIAQKNNLRGLQSIVIHNGVESSARETAVTVHDRKNLRASLNLPSDGQLFIYAGPLIPRKNPELLIHAFLCQPNKRDVLCLLGDGPLFSRCQQLAANCSRIVVPGFAPNVVNYLRAADYFVSASRAEGMPNAVLEGLAAGLPVILSDIPAHREILDICPDAGWLFSAGDHTALSECLDQATVNPTIRATTRHLVASHFSATSMSSAYQQLYRDSLSNVSDYSK